MQGRAGKGGVRGEGRVIQQRVVMVVRAGSSKEGEDMQGRGLWVHAD